MFVFLHIKFTKINTAWKFFFPLCSMQMKAYNPAILHLFAAEKFPEVMPMPCHDLTWAEV